MNFFIKDFFELNKKKRFGYDLCEKSIEEFKEKK